jgi:hypothetical protein
MSQKEYIIELMERLKRGEDPASAIKAMREARNIDIKDEKGNVVGKLIIVE